MVSELGDEIRNKLDYAELKLKIHLRLLRKSLEDARRQIACAKAQGDASLIPQILKDLADTYFRLEAYTMAIDVERLRLKRLATGSLPWFEARYRLALAEYRAGKSKDALHLIDATAILHPVLDEPTCREQVADDLRRRAWPNISEFVNARAGDGAETPNQCLHETFVALGLRIDVMNPHLGYFQNVNRNRRRVKTFITFLSGTALLKPT